MLARGLQREPCSKEERVPSQAQTPSNKRQPQIGSVSPGSLVKVQHHTSSGCVSCWQLVILGHARAGVGAPGTRGSGSPGNGCKSCPSSPFSLGELSEEHELLHKLVFHLYQPSEQDTTSIPTGLASSLPSVVTQKGCRDQRTTSCCTTCPPRGREKSRARCPLSVLGTTQHSSLKPAQGQLQTSV